MNSYCFFLFVDEFLDKLLLVNSKIELLRLLFELVKILLFVLLAFLLKSFFIYDFFVFFVKLFDGFERALGCEHFLPNSFLVVFVLPLIKIVFNYWKFARHFIHAALGVLKYFAFYHFV